MEGQLLGVRGRDAALTTVLTQNNGRENKERLGRLLRSACKWRLSSSPKVRRGSSATLFLHWEDVSFQLPFFPKNTFHCFSLLLPGSPWDNSSPYIVSHYKNAHKVKHFHVRFS